MKHTNSLFSLYRSFPRARRSWWKSCWTRVRSTKTWSETSIGGGKLRCDLAFLYAMASTLQREICPCTSYTAMVLGCCSVAQLGDADTCFTIDMLMWAATKSWLVSLHGSTMDDALYHVLCSLVSQWVRNVCDRDQPLGCPFADSGTRQWSLTWKKCTRCTPASGPGKLRSLGAVKPSCG